MNDQTDKSKLLYNPANWGFWAFIASLIPVGILYYRNSKLLKESAKGKKILTFAILYTILLMLLPIFGGSILSFLGSLAAIFIARAWAKHQIPAYEKMKREKGLKGGRNDVLLVLLFLLIWLMVFFGLPTLANRYIQKNYTIIETGDDRSPIILPKISKKASQETIKTDFADYSLSLSEGYSLSNQNKSLVDGAYQFEIRALDDKWDIYLVPLSAIEAYDEVCPPGDCMRDAIAYPKLDFFRSDMEGMDDLNEGLAVKVFDRKKYMTFTLPVNGDEGFFRTYTTYIGDVRVTLSRYQSSKIQDGESDRILSEWKIDLEK